MKPEVGKLEINQLTDILTSLNNLKTELDDLDLVKLIFFPGDLKKISDAVDNEFVKITKFSTLEAKVNNFENKVSDATTLIHINQYCTDKQNFDKNL